MEAVMTGTNPARDVQQSILLHNYVKVKGKVVPVLN
jgi:hypothetical protein